MTSHDLRQRPTTSPLLPVHARCTFDDVHRRRDCDQGWGEVKMRGNTSKPGSVRRRCCPRGSLAWLRGAAPLGVAFLLSLFAAPLCAQPKPEPLVQSIIDGVAV